MSKSVTLSEQNQTDLQTIVDYIYETEAKHFEEFCAAGCNPADHVYYTAVRLSSSVNGDN